MLRIIYQFSENQNTRYQRWRGGSGGKEEGSGLREKVFKDKKKFFFFSPAIISPRAK